jgi:hypothetical protein
MAAQDSKKMQYKPICESANHAVATKYPMRKMSMSCENP